MPIFGFVITLSNDSEAAAAALRALAEEHGVTLGAPQGLRLPVVLELAPEAHHEARIARWLALPAVLHVDYAFADFDDLESPTQKEELPT